MKSLIKIILLFLWVFLNFNASLLAFEDGDYIVGPGDVLKIEVWQEEDISGKFTIDRHGKIKHFLLGDIDVGGLTIPKIEEKIYKALAKDYMKDPEVKVSIEEYHSQKVFVLGEVTKPGFSELKGKTTLLNVILGAGGPTSNAGEKVSILREDSDKEDKDSGEEKKLDHILVDINRLFLKGDLSQNIFVKTGDIIYVSRLEKGNVTTRFYEKSLNIFYIVGEVKNPGAYEMKEGYTILNAILQAEGLTQYAAPNRTKLIRGEGNNKITFKLKMGDVLDKGDKSKDMVIEAGDLIIVPASLF